MYAAGRVGELVFMLSASALTGGWAWDDLVDLAAKQAQRLHQPMQEQVPPA